MGLAPAKHRYQATYSIVSRVIAAIIGGYVLANLIAILLSHLLPMSQPEAVMVSMLCSFAVYAAVAMWVFTTKTATKSWVGLLITSVVSAVWLRVLMPETLL
jgi:hypothetical protein